MKYDFKIKEISRSQATVFIQSLHYSKIMPKLTKHFLGCHLHGELVGVLTLGWGTQPKATIAKLFDGLESKDYYEIGKMCMSEKFPEDSYPESQMISAVVKWMKVNTPEKQFLYTWADGIVGKVGYVYQAANFLYGAYSETDVYVTENGEKVHPRTMQGLLPNKDCKKYGHRPNYEQRIELGLKRVKGKQYKYIYPINKKDRKYLQNSTVDWTLNYPKQDNLEWKVMEAGDKEWTTVSEIPFIYNKDFQEFNKRNVNKIEEKFANASLDTFFG